MIVEEGKPVWIHHCVSLTEHVMRPDEFAKAMQDIAYMGRDREDAHREADALLCEILRSLGYGAGIDVGDEVELWSTGRAS